MISSLKYSRESWRPCWRANLKTPLYRGELSIYYLFIFVFNSDNAFTRKRYSEVLTMEWCYLSSDGSSLIRGGGEGGGGEWSGNGQWWSRRGWGSALPKGPECWTDFWGPNFLRQKCKKKFFLIFYFTLGVIARIIISLITSVHTWGD